VAASNSIDSENADYVCDGVNDQDNINAAIGNLPDNGGSIYLREGTYVVGDNIIISKSNVALVGAGASTVIKIKDAKNDNMSVIYASGKDNLLVQNLRINGNAVNQTSGTMRGIYLYGGKNSKIVDCWVENLREYGIYLQSSSNNTVTGNTIQGNSLDNSNNNTITSNTFQGNGQHGIYLTASSNNTVAGNTIQGNDNHGIYLSSSSDNNTVSINMVVGNSQATDNTDNGIQVDNSNYNNIQGNTVRKGTGSKQQNTGITILSGTNNFVANNDLYQAGAAAAKFSDAGTETIFDYSQSGTEENAVPIDSTGLKTNTITFPVPFPSVPRVIANLANFDNDAIIAYIVQIETVTTDNFTIKTNVLSPKSDNVGDNADIMWYATVASQSGGRE